jgi:hypothetical protein
LGDKDIQNWILEKGVREMKVFQEESWQR